MHAHGWDKTTGIDIQNWQYALWEIFCCKHHPLLVVHHSWLLLSYQILCTLAFCEFAPHVLKSSKLNQMKGHKCWVFWQLVMLAYCWLCVVFQPSSVYSQNSVTSQIHPCLMHNSKDFTISIPPSCFNFSILWTSIVFWCTSVM